MFKVRLISFLLSLMLWTLAAVAQQAQPAQSAQESQQPFTLKVNAQFVVETVVVRDRDGKTIEGLTKDDFTITEDNVAQNISVFEFQKLDDTPIPTLADGGTIPKPTVEPVRPAQITPPPAG